MTLVLISLQSNRRDTTKLGALLTWRTNQVFLKKMTLELSLKGRVGIGPANNEKGIPGKENHLIMAWRLAQGTDRTAIHSMLLAHKM